MKKLLAVLFLSFTSLFAFENLTQENMQSKLENKNVIIEFYATWWGSCKVLGKNLTKYNTSKQDDVKIYKVNIQNQKFLTDKFGIKGVPTMVYMKNNEVLAKELGVRSVKQLKEYEKKHFSN